MLLWLWLWLWWLCEWLWLWWRRYIMIFCWKLRACRPRIFPSNLSLTLIIKIYSRSHSRDELKCQSMRLSSTQWKWKLDDDIIRTLWLRLDRNSTFVRALDTRKWFQLSDSYNSALSSELGKVRDISPLNFAARCLFLSTDIGFQEANNSLENFRFSIKFPLLVIHVISLETLHNQACCKIYILIIQHFFCLSFQRDNIIMRVSDEGEEGNAKP